MVLVVQLYPYQEQLVNEARQKLAEGNKSVLLVSPAGSGKSVVIAEIARLCVAKGGHVLFMVHRQELVNQITQSFQKANVNLMHTTIMTVGKIVHRLGKIPQPNLIITDETHHSKALTYRKIYQYYSNVPRLGFTATPWRMNGQGLDDIYQTMVEGQTVSWLIEHHYLAPYKYYSIKLLDDKKLKKSSTGDYTNHSMDDAIGKTIFGDVVKTYQDKTPGQQAIVYAHDIEHSQATAVAFNAVGIKAVHADAKTPKAKRSRIMTDFKAGKIKVLCNVDLISEGFDVPDCSVVIMLRPTASLVLDIQQSMRCMRYKPGKLATIIDHVANYTRFGLPDAQRQWSLTGRPKKKRSNNTGSSLPIKTCPHCFAVVPAQCKICPECGMEIKIAVEQMEVDKTANIEKVGEFKLTTDYSKVRLAKKKPDDAQSYQDLVAMAKAKGYKAGWAYVQAKRLGLFN